MRSAVEWLIITGLAVGFAASAQAEEVDIGKAEFQSSCASCHGADAKGKGPVSSQLKTPASDLTLLAKNNNGVFPANAVYEIIYGSKSVPAHGSREMPIWGNEYRAEALSRSRTSQQPEWYVRGRIVALLDYLSRMQQK